MINTTDPIADMLSRIRNAVLAGKNALDLPHSNIKHQVAELLATNGFLSKVSSDEIDGRKYLNIVINDESGSSVISEIDRLSRPGRRQYVKAKEIPTVKGGRGLVVVSTSQGIMTGDDAKKKGLGGELICKVY